jgi:preprotein translocase subunit Sec61beta
MPQQQMQMPSSFGGLMRYNEEYKSPFKLTPPQVMIFIIAIIGFVAAMKIFWPIVV